MPNARVWLTGADLAEAVRLHGDIRKGHRYWADLLSTVPFVWFIALVPVGLAEGLVLASAVIGAVLGIGVYLAWRIWRLVGGPRRQAANITGFLEAAWSEKGLSTRSDLGHSFHAWSSFKQWTERDGLFLLYVDLRTFQVLPRRLFADWTEILRMQNYLIAAGVRRVGPRRR